MERQAELEELKQENALLKFEIAELKRMIFGPKSERYVPSNPDQLQLPFAGLETPAEAPINPSEAELETVTRKKRQPSPGSTLPVRSPIPSDIPRVTEIILPEGIDLDKSTKIGETITEVLEYEPGRIFVRCIVRPKYKSTEDEKIHIADVPTLPIPKSNVGPGLLAHILVSKFVDHLPLYRQRKIFLREGVDIAESTINDWVSKGSVLLRPLYDLIIQKLRQCGYLQADEIPIPVLSRDKPGSAHKGYHWGYFSPLEKISGFEYQKSRSKQGPDIFLKGFTGYLQTDGYPAYDHFQSKEITLVGCMAHARRKFEHCLEHNKELAEHAMGLFGELYAIERKAREESMDHDARLILRIKESIPVLKELKAWLTEQIALVLPKSGIAKAMAYSLNFWDRLEQYTTNGILEIDNNIIENKMRPIALGRKNYMFAGSHDGAQNAAMMYSFFATCALNDVNPLEWLTDVLNNIGDYNIQNLEELLPQNWKATHMHH